MRFKNSIIDLIKIRKSIRSYESEKLKPDDIKKIIDLINKEHNTVFGFIPRFEFIDASDLDPNELKNLDTYGMITGAKYFIAGTIKNNSKNYYLVDFGYIFEKIILFITDLGLGTCWLGGTFNKKGFSEKILLQKDEVIQGVSLVGIISRKRSLRSSVIKAFAGSKNRKPWDKLFFNGSFSSPLDGSEVGSYNKPLEMVRIAPSAANLQPWRIIKEKNKNTFRFFINKSKYYLRKTGLNLQYIDMGISLCHFELAASDLSLKGKWEVKEGIGENNKYDKPSNVDYIISWDGS
jgi:hypothetical protein